MAVVQWLRDHLKAAMAAADKTQPLDPDIERRLTIAELESEIIGCQNLRARLQGEIARVDERLSEHLTELAKRVSSLGLRVEVPK